MVLHISGKLCALGLVIAALITAFSLPRNDGVALEIGPTATVLPAPIDALPERVSAVIGPVANPSYTLRATAYNSLESQTDSTPHITATGTRTSFGIIAVSRDMLDGDIPYGSLVRLRDLGNYYSGRGYGKFQTLLDSQGLFIVEDTMHPRKRQQVDIWFADFSSAVAWGVRRVDVEVVRYGRDGPELVAGGSDFDATPRLQAANR